VTALPGAVGVMPLEAEITIGRADFALFQALIYREAGIWLSEAKRVLLVTRLFRRVRELGISSFSLYYRRIVDDDPAELTRMLECVCTHETSFFRERQHFDYLERSFLPRLLAQAAAGSRPRRVRAWSAGCSSGEEPFSIAMSLAAVLPAAQGWQVDVLATDLSSRILERAAQAEWPIAKAEQIPRHHLKTFMLRGTGEHEGKMRASEALASMVRFQRLNLNDPFFECEGPFDLIFCRNVLIYFNAASKARVVERLIDRLASEGNVFVGHAETLHGVSNRLGSLQPTIYAHATACDR